MYPASVRSAASVRTELLRAAILAAVFATAKACGSDDRPPQNTPIADATANDVGEDSGTRDDAPSPSDGSGEDAPSADVVESQDAGESGVDVDSGCPLEMARIDAFCVDRYEAYLVDLDDAGVEHPHSPYGALDAGVTVRAKSAAGVVPQGYVSQIQAVAACAAAGKRLCTAAEFALSCRGPDAGNEYPYGGTVHQAGACNDGKPNPVIELFGADAAGWTYADLNDPRLNAIDGGLAPTGSFPQCISPFGVADCVGNLLEWSADPPDVNGHGRLRGGNYFNAELNGPGCLFVTSAHDLAFHDWSTGFRCCTDAR
jgi:hypothetical protein